MNQQADALVIGAGIAGLSAARVLQKKGLRVLVLEKSRGLGGRAATRRLETGLVDHGAQFFTARDPRFAAEVARWQAEELVTVWAQGFHRLRADGALESPLSRHPRYALPEGMSGLGKRLAAELERAPLRNARVIALRRHSQGFEAVLESGERHRAAALIVAVPAPQALELARTLEGARDGALERALGEVVFAPCFALLMGFPALKAPDWQGVLFEDAQVLAWAAHDSSKRAHADETILVLHASASFAKEALDRPAGEVERAMLGAVTALASWLAEPHWRVLHRWRYARAVRPHPSRCLAAPGLILCGDWCGGDTIEAAYLSGLAAAETLYPGS